MQVCCLNHLLCEQTCAICTQHIISFITWADMCYLPQDIISFITWADTCSLQQDIISFIMWADMLLTTRYYFIYYVSRHMLLTRYYFIYFVSRHILLTTRYYFTYYVSRHAPYNKIFHLLCDQTHAPYNKILFHGSKEIGVWLSKATCEHMHMF